MSNFSEIDDSISGAVEKMKLEHPEKYEAAQKMGEQMMKLNFNPQQFCDTEGDKILTHHLIQHIKDYSLSLQDLTDIEISTLKRVHPNDWETFFHDTQDPKNVAQDL